MDIVHMKRLIDGSESRYISRVQVECQSRNDRPSTYKSNRIRLDVNMILFQLPKSGSTACSVEMSTKERDLLSVEYHRSSA